MTTTEVERTATAWPLARRLLAGVGVPGGRRMMERALEGLNVDEGSRVVEMAPGVGAATAIVLERRPRTWTGVEPDPLAAAHLRRTVVATGRDVVEAPLHDTGLPAGEASAVLLDGVLSTLDDEARAAVLAESARLVRAGGRVAIHDLAPAPGGALGEQARTALAAAGLRPETVAVWRAALEDAGLVAVGSTVGPVEIAPPRAVVRGMGPRAAMRVTRATALDAGAWAGGVPARTALTTHELALRAAVVVAEAPLILGMRRPRR